MEEKALLHLKNELIPFWLQLENKEYGGCYGLMSETGNVDKTADKSVLLLCRNLWFFSSVAQALHNAEVAHIAERYYEYLQSYFFDRENGGLHSDI